MKILASEKHIALRAIDFLYLLIIALPALGVAYFTVDSMQPLRFASLKTVYPTFEDFFNYLVAGEMAASAHRLTPYDFHIQHDLAATHLSGRGLELFPYVYQCPFIFPVMLPFAHLAENAAFALYVTINTVVFILGISLLVSLRTESRSKKIVFLLFILTGALASLAAFRTITLGQPIGLISGALALTCWALLRKKDWLAGAMLAVSTIKPHFTVFFLALAPALGRGRALIAFVLFELLFFCTSIFVIGFNAILQFPAGCVSGDMAHSIPQEMINLRALLSPFMSVKIDLAIAACIELAVLAFAFFRLRPGVGSQAVTQYWILAVGCIAALFINVHAHLYDCLLYAVAAVLTLPVAAPSALLQSCRAWEKVWRLVLVAYPLISWAPIFLPFGGGYATVVPFQLTNAILLVAGLAVLRQKMTATN